MCPVKAIAPPPIEGGQFFPPKGMRWGVKHLHRRLRGAFEDVHIPNIRVKVVEPIAPSPMPHVTGLDAVVEPDPTVIVVLGIH
jgi:hypothetical protein